MKQENKADEKRRVQIKGDVFKSGKQMVNNNKNTNTEDPNFDINNFCPDLEASQKKIRSHTVRESVKKGKLKKYIEEEKANKVEQKKYLKTPQVRPIMRALNPTPLRLNPFCCKSSKLNLIKEENIILSEHEEESENSEYSSSSFFDDEEEEEEEDEEEEKHEDKKENINKGKNIEQKILEEEEEKEEEKEQEKEKEKDKDKEKKDEEEKEEEEYDDEEEEEEEEDDDEEEIKKDNNINVKKEENTNTGAPMGILGYLKKKEEDKTTNTNTGEPMGILGCLKKEKENKITNSNANTIAPMGILGCLKKEHDKKEEKKNDDENLYVDKKKEEYIEENELISLRKIRKGMKEYRKSFKKRNRDMFNLFDLNIKNSHQKFKKDVLNEKKSEDEDSSDEKKINELNNTKKCRPILDFYVHNTPIIKTKV